MSLDYITPLVAPPLTDTDRANIAIQDGSRGVPTIRVLEREIRDWLSGATRAKMWVAARYYRNESDIQKKTSRNPNNSNLRLEHAFLRKLVDQKTGYLLSREPVFSCDSGDADYQAFLDGVFDKSFLRALRVAGKDAVIKGISWLQAYFDADGHIRFAHIPAEEVVPLWADGAHTRLDGVIRAYDTLVYEGDTRKTVTRAEYWRRDGVTYYVLEGGKLIPDAERELSGGHFVMSGADVQESYAWDRVPFVPVKYNDDERPLLDSVKTLIDDYNFQASVNDDVLADIRNVIYKIVGYPGDNLDNFLKLLHQYGVISVDSDPPGDVSVLRSDPNTTAAEATLTRLRKAIYDFGGGVDDQAETIGAASGVALRFRYAGLDMDSNIFENEIQAAFESLLWFVNQAARLSGLGDFSNETVALILNRDIIISETEAVDNIMKLRGLLPDESLIAQVPWVSDAGAELAKRQAEREAALGAY